MRYERPPPPGFCIQPSDPVAACLGRVEGWWGRDCGLSSVRGDAGETSPRSPTDPHQSTGPSRPVQVWCGRRLPSLQPRAWDVKVGQRLQVSVVSAVRCGCLPA